MSREASIQSNLVHWADEFRSDPSELSIMGTREAGLLWVFCVKLTPDLSV